MEPIIFVLIGICYEQSVPYAFNAFTANLGNASGNLTGYLSKAFSTNSAVTTSLPT
jgi:hypothetical protein